MSLDDIIDDMGWTPWQRIPLKSGGAKSVRALENPGPDWWVLWREMKPQLKAAGYGVFNRDGSGWRVEQWVPAGRRVRITATPPRSLYAKREAARSGTTRSDRSDYWAREIRRAPR